MTSIVQSASPLFIILNCRSGKTDTSAICEQIEAVLKPAQRDYSITLVDNPEDLLKISQDAVKLAKENNGIVVAAGGDGAIHTIAQQVLAENCPMALIPQGTFNYFARTHGIPESIEGALQVILAGHLEPVQIGRVNDTIFLVNASLGLYPDLLETREVFKNQLGRSRAVAFVAALYTLFLNRQIIHLDIETQNKALRFSTPSLFVGNNRLQLEHVGVPESHDIEHGKLAAIIPSPLDRVATLKLIFRGVLGKLGEDENIVNFNFKKMKVRISKFLGRKVKVAIDGEIFWLKAPLEFDITPQPLWLIKPHPENLEKNKATL
ncbi:diacylglycerol/lipid kinase family protein [Crenothrix sp.]|uniref:diacylglycerol/lipid kinase family protein n=1 Tax=Crenothrix sp. TaxID=3100433 RepID=UPI00374DF3A7